MALDEAEKEKILGQVRAWLADPEQCARIGPFTPPDDPFRMGWSWIVPGPGDRAFPEGYRRPSLDDGRSEPAVPIPPVDEPDAVVGSLDDDGEVRSEAQVLPFSVPATTPETRPIGAPDRASRRRLVVALAWAASLGAVYVLGGRPFGRRSLELPRLDASGSTLAEGGALGGQAWSLSVPSARRAFVTLAVQEAGTPPRVLPDTPGTWLEAKPGAPLRYVVQAQTGSSVYIILTETPATDELANEAVREFQRASGEWPHRDPEQMIAFVERTLQSLGYQRFSVKQLLLNR